MINEQDDLDEPITLRKGKRAYTQHPICKFVSLDSLSPQFRAFTTQLDNTTIPTNIQEALKHPR